MPYLDDPNDPGAVAGSRFDGTGDNDFPTAIRPPAQFSTEGAGVSQETDNPWRAAVQNSFAGFNPTLPTAQSSGSAAPWSPQAQAAAGMAQSQTSALQTAQAMQGASPGPLGDLRGTNFSSANLNSVPSFLSGMKGTTGSTANVDGKQYSWQNDGWQPAVGAAAGSNQTANPVGTPSFNGWENAPPAGTAVPGDYKYNPSLVGPGANMTGSQALQQIYGPNFQPSGGLAGFNPTFTQAASPATQAGNKYFPQTPLNPFSFATAETGTQVRDLLAKQGIQGELSTSPHASGTPEQMINIGGNNYSVGELAKRLMTSDPSWVYRGLRDEASMAGGQINTQYGVQDGNTGQMIPGQQSPNAPQGVFQPPASTGPRPSAPQQGQTPPFGSGGPGMGYPPSGGSFGNFGGGFGNYGRGGGGFPGGGGFGGPGYGFSPYSGNMGGYGFSGGGNPYGGFGGGFNPQGGGFGGGGNMPDFARALAFYNQMSNPIIQQFQRRPLRSGSGQMGFGNSGYYPSYF